MKNFTPGIRKESKDNMVKLEFYIEKKYFISEIFLLCDLMVKKIIKREFDE